MEEVSTSRPAARRATEAARPAPRGRDDLAFARGLALALLLSLAGWAVILWALLRLL